jgi:F0F1-type ATP synthase membrane subunit b/b'
VTTQEPERAGPAGPLTALPRVEDLPVVAEGFDQQRVREALEAFRRHTLQLQAQLRVLQAAGTSAQVEPTGHAVRMDALHLIRAAAEFADQLERDSQTASAAQLRRTQEEIRRRQRDLQTREQEVNRFRKESEDQRAELLNAARAEAREIVAAANQEATRELQEAEARGARLLEQARHQASELTNSARAEVEQTLEWARMQANTVISRAQQGAEQLLAAAGLGSKQMTAVVETIIRSVEKLEETATPVDAGRPTPPVAPVSSPRVVADAVPETAAPDVEAVEPQAEARPGAGAEAEREEEPEPPVE